jgi:hypothetical protein
MRVEWTESALDQLADLFVQSDLVVQQEIEATVEAINSVLADDPDELGESRSAGRRVWFVHPLVVIFRIIEDEHCVIVSHVSRLRRR